MGRKKEVASGCSLTPRVLVRIRIPCTTSPQLARNAEPVALTCTTPGCPREFRVKWLAVVFKRVLKDIFGGLKHKRTRYGGYNVADPEKALLDWVYLGRHTGSTIHTDELDLERLDHNKLLQYAARFPSSVKHQILEVVAAFKLAQ